MKGKNRCRLHGGAKGSGGQRGEANGAYRHGGFTSEAIELRREVSRLLQATREDPVEFVEMADAKPGDPAILEAMRALLGGKLTRAEKSERNKARWSAGDRRPWGGEDRRGWPKWGRGRRRR